MRPVVAPLALAAVILAAAPASAAMLGDSSLSYHAWRTVTVDGRQYSGPAYHEKGHERHEQDLLGMRGVFLLDDVTAQGILVLPAVKTEVDFPLPALLAELDAPDLTRHPDGTEEIAGLATTKYRIDPGGRAGEARRGRHARAWRAADENRHGTVPCRAGPGRPGLVPGPQRLFASPGRCARDVPGVRSREVRHEKNRPSFPKAGQSTARGPSPAGEGIPSYEANSGSIPATENKKRGCGQGRTPEDCLNCVAPAGRL